MESYDRSSEREMQPDERVEVRLHNDDEWYAATVTGKARKMQVTLDVHPFGHEPFTYVADESSIAEWRLLPDQEIPAELDHLYEIERVPANWGGEDDPDTVDELPAPPRKDIPEADRELLELAARALGARFEEVDGEGYGNLHFADGSVVYGWNSLLFSGDALELAVDLGMDFRIILQRNFTTLTGDVTHVGIDRPQWTGKESHGDDARAATRRAVTRAAAEIGKTMA